MWLVEAKANIYLMDVSIKAPKVYPGLFPHCDDADLCGTEPNVAALRRGLSDKEVSFINIKFVRF